MAQQVIEGSRGRATLLLLLAVGFTAGGILMIRSPDTEAALIGWLSIGFFGVLGIPALLYMIVQPPKLILRDDTFTMLTGFGRKTEVRWADVEQLGILEIRGAKMLGYTLVPAAQSNSFMANTSRSLGVDGAIPRLSITCEIMLEVMIGFRARAQATSQ